MRLCAPAAALGLAFLVAPGCAYKNQYTYANTRKLMDSDAPAVTKVFFAPLVSVFESVYAPVTVYMDSKGYVEGQREPVYLSFIGAQTLYSSRLDTCLKVLGSLFVLPIDTAWFPFAGSIDTIQALSAPDPEPVAPTTPHYTSEPG